MGDFKAESSAHIRQRVIASRKLQSDRLRRTKIYSNAQMNTRQVKKYCQIGEQSSTLLETAINALGLSARAYNRILKIARTIADLEANPQIQADHIAEAIQYRNLDRGKKLV